MSQESSFLVVLEDLSLAMEKEIVEGLAVAFDVMAFAGVSSACLAYHPWAYQQGHCCQ